jgi:hypothetical protein
MTVVTMIEESGRWSTLLPALTAFARHYPAWMIPGATADDFKVTPNLSS